VTTSLEADELAVDMITCESAQNPEVRPSDQRGAAPFQPTPEAAPWANREGAQGQGDGRKFLKPPNPERGGAEIVLKSPKTSKIKDLGGG
jgi:hypothetical protein